MTITELKRKATENGDLPTRMTGTELLALINAVQANGGVNPDGTTTMGTAQQQTITNGIAAAGTSAIAGATLSGTTTVAGAAGVFSITALTNYASNAAAITGGLAVGNIYRTAGAVMVVV